MDWIDNIIKSVSVFLLGIYGFIFYDHLIKEYYDDLVQRTEPSMEVEMETESSEYMHGEEYQHRIIQPDTPPNTSEESTLEFELLTKLEICEFTNISIQNNKS
jgi:hypothetical protein